MAMQYAAVPTFAQQYKHRHCEAVPLFEHNTTLNYAHAMHARSPQMTHVMCDFGSLNNCRSY
jgi:hypothetical protein